MALNREIGFLAELLASQDLATVTDKGITTKFLTGRYKKAFSYILKHSAQYGKIPSIQEFERKFKDIKLPYNKKRQIVTGECIEYWCDEVRIKKKHNTIIDYIDQVQEKLGELETDKAFELLVKLVNLVQTDIVEAKNSKINENTASRKEDYKERQRSGGVTGISTGIDLLDKIIGGLKDGELVTYMAYTGVGKTWLLVILAVLIAKAGYRVLFFTTEMTDRAVFKRIDAVWNDFNYTLFKDGQLHPKDEKKYFKYLDEMEEKSDDEVLLVVEEATGGVSQISAKIDQYDPDVVLVDGGYLLQDEDGDEDNWMGLIRVWRALHRLCINKKIPIVVNTQSKDETGATLKSVNFSKAIAQDTDVFFVLEQDEEAYNEREVQLRFLKIREGDRMSLIRMNWDFDAMDYSTIYKDTSTEKDAEVKAEGVMVFGE